MSEIHLRAVFLAFLIAFWVWVMASQIAVIYWFFAPDRQRRFVKWHKAIAVAVYIGAFLGLLFLLVAGVESLLVFVPEDWGSYDEYGDFRSHRLSIAVALGLGFALFFVYVFLKCEDLRDKNRELGTVCEIYERKEELRRCSRDFGEGHSRDFLLQQREQTQAELHRVSEGGYEREFSTEEERKIRILQEVLYEIDKLISDTKLHGSGTKARLEDNEDLDGPDDDLDEDEDWNNEDLEEDEDWEDEDDEEEEP